MKVHAHLFEPLYKVGTTLFAKEKKRKKARKGEITTQRAYYIPILESLIELGGSGRMKDVEEKVEKKMKSIFKEKDYETLSSDGITIRWRNKTEWARNDLVNKYGYLKKDSPRGIWEISDEGRRYYKENKDKWKSEYL